MTVPTTSDRFPMSAPVRPRLVWSLLLLVFSAGLFLSCQSQQSSAPGASSVERVAVQAPPNASDYTPSLTGPLRLLSATPSGEIMRMQSPQPVTVTFSRPMVPLGEAPPVPDSILVVRPENGAALDGSFRWEGTQTLVFTPNQDLAPATRYVATLVPGLADQDGNTLSDPYTWKFDTTRPRLVSSSPAPRARYVAPDASVHLSFNLPVDADAVAPYVRLQSRSGLDVNWSVRNDGDSTVVMDLDRNLPPDSDWGLTVEAGLPSTLGTLGMVERQQIVFGVRPSLRLTDIDQPRYRREEAFFPGAGIQLEFSTPVKFENLRKAVSFAPEVEFPQGIEARDPRVSTSHVLPVQLEPNTNYTLMIDEVVDEFGQRLSGVSQSFRTRGYEASFYPKTGYLAIEAEQNPVLPIFATNAGSFDVGTKRLGIDDLVPAMQSYGRRYRSEAPVAMERVVDLGLQENTPSIYPMYLDSLLTNGTGVVGIGMKWTDREARNGPRVRDYSSFAQFTNLGLTGKFSAHQTLVFVTDLSTGTPLANVNVSLRDEDNRELWTGTTDRQGRVMAPGWAGLGLEKEDRYGEPTVFAIAEYQGDLAVTSSERDDGIEAYRFGINTDYDARPQKEAGSLFTDRGLYKAGDTVYIKGILRSKTDGDWMSIRDSVRLVVRNPRDEVVLDARLRPSRVGTVDTSWTAPSNASQGPYDMRIGFAADQSLDESRSWRRGGITTGTFRVDSFRRATFSVEATTAASQHIAGDFFEGQVTARYLFGAGMQGQPVRYRLTQEDARYQPPGYRGWQFGPMRDYTFETLTQGDGTLDSTSAFSERTRIPTSTTGAPTELTWTATVESPDEQTISSQATVTVHPGRFYVGLKPETSFLDLTEDSTLAVDVTTVTPGGLPVGDKAIDLELVRVDYNSVREVGNDGRLRWRSERTETVVRTLDLTTAKGSAERVSFTIPQGGSYRIKAESQDVRGNVVRTTTRFYVTGRGYVAWRRDDDDRIDLVPSKETYAPGETARILVPNPYEEATALITVEREGILDSYVRTFTDSAPQIEIPIEERHLPNVYVSVILLSGRTAPPQVSADPGAPGFKIGYASLRVDPGERRLAVSVTPGQEEYRPGDNVSVELQLTDADGNGVPGEIAFAAADAGVLNLIGYRLPDPFDAFYGPRPLGVTTTELRAHLVEQRNYGQKAEPVGGGGGADASMMRTDFRPLAHWEPSVQTDAGGRATVTFRLPESLTTFRFMATGLTADHKFGQGQTDVVVTKPLVLKPALPRFARRGDLFDAGVLVTNRTGEGGVARVQVEADGITLSGGNEQSVDVPAGATRPVRFSWDALTLGTARLRFRASLNDEQDAFETTLPIQQPRIKEADAQFASTQDLARERVRLPADRIPDAGSLGVQLSSTALVGLDGALEYLFDYPYGCLEQRTSRVRPLLAGSRLLDTFDMQALSGNRNEVVTEWLNGLGEYWQGDGFGLWKSSSAVNRYVTAYVVLALAEARDAGYSVPQPLTREAVDALDRLVRQRTEYPSYYTNGVWKDTRAMMLYALTRHGRVLDGEINDLADNPPPGTDGISFLLRAVIASDSAVLARYERRLADVLRSRIRVEGTRAYLQAPDDDAYGWIFATDARATAFGLSALIEHDAGPDMQQLAQRMVRYLMEDRSAGRWRSTQENAAVVDAFQTYVDAYENETPDFTARVRLAEKEILTDTFQGLSTRTVGTSVQASDFPSGPSGETYTVPVEVEKEGTGRLYYSMRLITFRQGPVESQSKGLSVERRIQRLDDRGNPVGNWMSASGTELALASGDLVRVQLRLSSPTGRTYVVVDDPLPAGLETVNSAFATTDTGVTQAADAGSGQWWGSFNHTETRDDRVLLFADYLRRGEHTYTYVARATTQGTFRHPPVEAEMMYEPATRGRTASSTLIVESAPPQAGR